MNVSGVFRKCKKCGKLGFHHILVWDPNIKPQELPLRPEIQCSDCGYKWWGRLSNEDRGLPPEPRKR